MGGMVDKDGCLRENGVSTAISLHGFEQSFSVVGEGHEQLELGSSRLLDWKITHTHLYRRWRGNESALAVKP